MPRLTAREQRDDLQQNGHPEHPRGGVGNRGRELLAAPGEHEREHRRPDLLRSSSSTTHSSLTTGARSGVAHSVPERWLGGRAWEEDGADWVGEPGVLLRL